MLDEETLKNLDLVDLLSVINAKAEDEAKEFNELAESFESLTTAVELQKLTILDLGNQIEMLKAELKKSEARVTSKEAERLKVKGQNASLQAELKDLKSYGDVKSLVRRTKEHKEKSAELQKALEKAKRDRLKADKEAYELRARLSYLEDFPLFGSEEGETIFLHSQKTVVEFEKGQETCVILKFWHPTGIGRLVTYNGSKISLSNGDLKDIEDVAPMSKEMQDFCLGWFSENVFMQGSEQMYRPTKKAS